jgi:hypothetical protein
VICEDPISEPFTAGRKIPPPHHEMEARTLQTRFKVDVTFRDYLVLCDEATIHISGKVNK